MFECPGLKPGDGGRFRVCERTNLLFVEFNTVSCSSRSTMEAGLWTGKGYSAPWMYHRVAGQYTLFEKQLLSDFAPRQRRPGPRVLQDSTNWLDAPSPPRWGPPGPEGKERRGRAEASPEPRAPRSPAFEGGWGAAPAAEGGGIRAALEARSPPSYEAHLLLRAGQGPRKENRPRPPAYVAPPAYEAPHRTVRPGGKPRQAEAAPTEPQGGARPAGAARLRGPAQAPGGWSYLLGARTWAGRRRPPERAEASPAWAQARPRSPPQPRSHTLPRLARRPRRALPAGWAFGRSAARPEPPGGQEGGGRRRRAGGGRPGGVLLIDATCVVIRTHYIPPARAERVRYLGPPGPQPATAAAPASLQERAARILGLPPGELGFAEPAARPSGEASPGRSCPPVAPGRAPSPPAGEPASPAPSPASVPAEAPAPSGPAGGCAPRAGAGPSRGVQSSPYGRDLRAAMARIRRHTAPDSDTDEEPEQERPPGPKGRRAGGALSRSSSSSLESGGSAATVVPGGARSGGGGEEG